MFNIAHASLIIIYLESITRVSFRHDPLKFDPEVDNISNSYKKDLLLNNNNNKSRSKSGSQSDQRHQRALKMKTLYKISGNISYFCSLEIFSRCTSLLSL